MVVASSQAGGWPLDGTSSTAVYLLLFCVNTGVASLMTYFSWSSSAQSQRRAELVNELTATNRRLSETLAENAGLHQQLVQQAREAGTVDERRRLAREIHDTLAQGLIGIITQLQAIDGASPGTDAGRARVDAALGLARESLSEARRSVQALRPEALEAGRLPEALTDVAARWAERHGPTSELHLTGTPQRLGPEIEVTLLRTAQEALANVARHARATSVHITLSYLDDVVTLDVRDDGVGFDPASRCGSSDGGGFGLLAMAQRVAAQAGNLDIESEPGAGTVVSVSLPLDPNPTAAAVPSPAAPAPAPAPARR
jgi:signal transduction histidine kinase